MKPINLALRIALVMMIFTLAACFQPVPRPGVGPTHPPQSLPAPTLSPATQPAPTPASPPAPRATPVETPTGPATPRPIVLPVDSTLAPPTPTAAPTAGPPPVEPTPQPTDIPGPAATPASKIFLEVRDPVDGSQVRSGAVLVSGVVSPGAIVHINDGPAIVDEDGKFRGAVDLVSGRNEIQVVATDIQGNQAAKIVTVTSITVPARPFMLVITEPKHESIVSDERIRISGRTGPEAVVSVNGSLQSVDLMGSFSTQVVLQPGPNLFDVVATNVDGRTSSTVVAVIYRP